jgi:hypothetical protein
MTFKEQLTAKAEQTDIQKEIDYIKQKLEEFYYKRTFTVCLYKAHQTLAIGGNANKNSTECFIPESFSLSDTSVLYIRILRWFRFFWNFFRIDNDAFCNC